MEEMSVLLSPTASSDGTLEDDIFDHEDAGTTATTDDENENGATAENSDNPLIEMAPSSEKAVAIESSANPASETIPDPPPEDQEYTMKEYLLPKFQIIKILFQVDFLAGCIVIGNTIISGGINSLKVATSTELTAAILELIVNKIWDRKLLASLLMQHLFYDILLQISNGLSDYARRRSNKPLRKRLSVD